MFRPAVLMAAVAARIISAQAAPAADASGLLERAREKILTSTRRMPKYTCLETIDRTYYFLRPQKHSRHLMTEAPVYSCSGNRAGDLSLDAKDRLRVEVAESSEGEIHSWPGASRFDTRSIGQVIPFGPVSTGSFGTYLLEIFTNPGAHIEFIGSKRDGPREMLEYSFRVPVEASHFRVKSRSQAKWRVSGISGSFEIYAATADLARLVIETDPLSPDTEMCQAKIMIDYRFILIGGAEFLIPRQSELEILDSTGGKTDSVTRFSACREYSAESDIRFDDQDTSAGSTKTPPLRAAALPPGVSLTLALVDAIDLSTAAAGDSVSAKAVHSVRARGSKEVLVPTDAIVRGRILENRYQFNTSQFIISIRFDTLEIKGTVSPLSARLDRELKADRRAVHGFATRGTEFSLPPPGSTEPGSYLVFPAMSGAYVIPAGFRSKWTTVLP